MTLFQKINRACKLGKYPIVRDNQNIMIVSPIKDKDGFWKITLWQPAVDKASTLLGKYVGASETIYDDLEKRGVELIGYYYPPIQFYKVGDKVLIRKDLKNTMTAENWIKLDNDFKSTRGLEGQIVAINNYHSIYVVEIDEVGYNYRHDQLEPSFTDETIEINEGTYVVTKEFLEQLKKLKKIK